MLEEIKLWHKKIKDGLQLAHDFHFTHAEQLPKNIKKIVFAGMGGSGIAGRIIKTFLDKKCNIPVFILDSPELPEFIDTDTLAFVVSYSGNTWETIDILNALAEKFIPTIVISHNGKALEIAENKNLPFILLPSSTQPRAALGHFLGIILGLLDLMNVIPAKEILDSWMKHADIYIPKLLEKGYFSEFLDVVDGYERFHVWGISSDSAAFAYRAQTQFNENSKVQAVFSSFTECCHNLLVGFTDCKTKPFVLFFNTEFLSAHLSIAVQATTQILREHGVILYKPPLLGDTWEEQLFHIVLWSDFASYYLGEQRGVQISPVKIIDELKAKHKDEGIK